MLARKHRGRDEWLLCAWAAGGVEREVAAVIPKLGKVRLLARPSGSVYRAVLERGRPELTSAERDM